MPLPDALLALVTLGTAHGTAELPTARGALGTLLGQVDGPPEAQMLLLAAALSLQEKAGWLPLQADQPLPPPGPPDDRPLVPEAAARHLAQMLAGEYNAMLPEWLAAANARGLRPPPELLPALLDLGRGPTGLRPLLFPFLGPRAVWLAEQAGAGPWAYMRLNDAEMVWQEAEPPVRVALLAHLRWRDPAQGRNLLVSTWSSEGARQREAFLRELAQGLGADDEPFLEAALDDRAAGVRAEAARLLARLPGSAFNRRMAGRATALLSLQRGWRGARLAVDEKGATPGASWERDGLSPEPVPGFRSTPAVWLLQQLLAYVPPAHWQRLWKLRPRELLDVAQHAPEEFAFLHGLAWGSYRASDHDFALLLVREALPELPAALLPLLLAELPAPALDAALLPWLQRRREPFSPEHPAYAALPAHQQRWSRELAAAVLDALSRTLHPANPYPPPHAREMLRHVARSAPPEDGPALVAGLSPQGEAELPPAWRKEADDMLFVLDFRRRMLKELEL
jgi:hypothetical protein